MATVWKAAWAMFPCMLFAPSAHALIRSASKEPDDADALRREIEKLTAMVERQEAFDHTHTPNPTSAPAQMAPDTTFDSYACEPGVSRAFDLRGSEATMENCHAECMTTTSCVLYSGVLDLASWSWCIGCDSFQNFTVQNDATSSAVAFVKATPNPTPAPTPSPAPPVTSVSGVGPVSAVGDPHLTNVHGERFDLMQQGKHNLIKIPRQRGKTSLLRVDAVADRLGGQCADIYFQELNITGKWADAKQNGGFRYRAQTPAEKSAKRAHWIRLGPVQLKVAHGRTHKGVKYLNFYVKNLGHTGYVIGGLLGEDDHTKAEKAPNACLHLMAL